MCAPLATVAAWSAIAGTGLMAYGQYRQGQTAQKMANYNADVARVKAADAISAGAIAEQQQRNKTRQILGAQTAAMAASGSVIGSGTNADILDQTVKYGELDAQTIRTNAWKAAFGLETQARADNLQGALAASAGQNRAFTTLISSAPDIYKAGGKNGLGWWA